MAKLGRLMPREKYQLIDLEKIPFSGKKFVGELSYRQMPRLTTFAEINAKKAVYNLAFTKDSEGIININGKISATLVLPCQRCLNDMTLAMNISVNLGICISEVTNEYIAEDLELIFVENSKVSLLNLIEEEILLDMPLTVLHKISECPATAVMLEHSKKVESPFASLQTIKKGN